MHAINDRRLLRVLVQRQCAELATLELEFGGLKYMNLIPLDETYTCEILAAALYFQDGYIYWCDKTADDAQDAGPFESILICAERLRWRPDRIVHGAGGIRPVVHGRGREVPR